MRLAALWQRTAKSKPHGQKTSSDCFIIWQWRPKKNPTYLPHMSIKRHFAAAIIQESRNCLVVFFLLREEPHIKAHFWRQDILKRVTNVHSRFRWDFLVGYLGSNSVIQPNIFKLPEEAYHSSMVSLVNNPLT